MAQFDALIAAAVRPVIAQLTDRWTRTRPFSGDSGDNIDARGETISTADDTASALPGQMFVRRGRMREMGYGRVADSDYLFVFQRGADIRQDDLMTADSGVWVGTEFRISAKPDLLVGMAPAELVNAQNRPVVA